MTIGQLLTSAFITTLIINALSLIILNSAFTDNHKTLFEFYGSIAVGVVGISMVIAFKHERSLFWPYLAININASAIVTCILLIILYPLSWPVILALMFIGSVMLGLNVGNLADKNSPPPKFIYVTYQLLCASSILLYYWWLMPN